MFFYLSKTVGYLGFPLTLCLLLIVAGAIINRILPRLSGILIWLGAIFLWVCSIDPVSSFLIAPLEIPYQETVAPEKVSAIIILGGASDLALSTSKRVELGPAGDRFLVSLQLAKKYPDAAIVYTGGTGAFMPQDIKEGSIFRDIATQMGVERSRILVDDASRNTRENATETKKLLPDTPDREMLLVTSAFHMTRSLACFRKVGMNPVPYAVDFRGHRGPLNPVFWIPQVDNLATSTHAIKEYIGLITYRISGYI